MRFACANGHVILATQKISSVAIEILATQKN
jgi:hypothetical protein